MSLETFLRLCYACILIIMGTGIAWLVGQTVLLLARY